MGMGRSSLYSVLCMFTCIVFIIYYYYYVAKKKKVKKKKKKVLRNDYFVYE